MVKKSVKRKVIKRPPRIFKDPKTGERYIRIGRKKIKLASKLNDVELMKTVIENMIQKKTRRIRRPLKPKVEGKHDVKPPVAVGVSGQPVNIREYDLKQQIEKEKKERTEQEDRQKKQLLEIESKAAKQIKDIKKTYKALPAPTPTDEPIPGKAIIITEKEGKQIVDYKDIAGLFTGAKKFTEASKKAKEEQEKRREAEIKAKAEEEKRREVELEKQRIENAQREKEIKEKFLSAKFLVKKNKDTLRELFEKELKVPKNKNIGKSDMYKQLKDNENFQKILDQITPDTTAEEFAFTLETAKKQNFDFSFFPNEELPIIPTDEGKNGKEQQQQQEEEMEFIGDGKGKGGLWNYEIEEMMEEYKPSFLGVIALDQIKELLPMIKPDNKYSFIMNLDPSNKPGSHWIAVYLDPIDDLSVEYYDSYGEDPPKEFQRDIKYIIDKLEPNVYLKFKINRIQDQHANSKTCGYHSARFLMNRYSGYPFKECTMYNAQQGEAQAKKLMKKFDYI